jgi:hypothetical protein
LASNLNINFGKDLVSIINFLIDIDRKKPLLNSIFLFFFSISSRRKKTRFVKKSR